MACILKDYYKEGVPLGDSTKIVLGLLDNDKVIVDEILRDYSRFRLIAKNLESLGFLIHTHAPAAPEVTVRGGTLVLSKRPYIPRLRRESVPTEIGRFVLLKAVRDADWQCFREFYIARFVNIPQSLTKETKIKDSIRVNYYPQYLPGNMDHWYGLHLSLVKEINAEKVLGRQENIRDESLKLLDPYCRGFQAKSFFNRPLQQPTFRRLEDIVDKALAICKNELLGSSYVGHCETLKTLIQIFMLNADLFEDELGLSEKIIRILKDRNVGLLRSNYSILTDGRGFIDDRGTEQLSFKLFSLS